MGKLHVAWQHTNSSTHRYPPGQSYVSPCKPGKTRRIKCGPVPWGVITLWATDAKRLTKIQKPKKLLLSQLRRGWRRFWKIKHARNDDKHSWSGVAGGQREQGCSWRGGWTCRWTWDLSVILRGLVFSFFSTKLLKAFRKGCVSLYPSNSAQDDSLGAIWGAERKGAGQRFDE